MVQKSFCFFGSLPQPPTSRIECIARWVCRSAYRDHWVRRSICILSVNWVCIARHWIWHLIESSTILSVILSVLQCVAVCCSVLQCVAVCCSVSQCVAVCCSVLQYSSIATSSNSIHVIDSQYTLDVYIECLLSVYWVSMLSIYCGHIEFVYWVHIECILSV